ncbi:MAG: outer membrane beta-barrel protein [Pseudomonadota bacterium]|nr:outer membrane beta-barrel protein [Pseudomonadota bacterium]
MFRPALALLAAAGFAAAGADAAAQDRRWFLHAGPGYLAPDESAEIQAGGAPFPGADVSIDSSLTAAVEIGRFFTPNISASVTFGLPPREDINGAGTLAPFGKLGELHYGPAALTAQYHLNPTGQFNPYVGAGVALQYNFADDDAAAVDLEVENAGGPAIQAGVQMMFNERFGAFVDYKKAFYDTEASGRLLTPMGPVPFTADVQVDPSFLHGGIVFRF